MLDHVGVLGIFVELTCWLILGFKVFHHTVIFNGLKQNWMLSDAIVWLSLQMCTVSIELYISLNMRNIRSECMCVCVCRCDKTCIMHAHVRPKSISVSTLLESASYQIDMNLAHRMYRWHFSSDTIVMYNERILEL
jgi:hypothetical protein